MAVALRKESVDRNSLPKSSNMEVIKVALRKESVDRNSYVGVMVAAIAPSLSARRAGIEIWHIHGFLRGLPKSLSARRAWIEIHVVYVIC